jgi:hypothetical protein
MGHGESHLLARLRRHRRCALPRLERGPERAHHALDHRRHAGRSGRSGRYGRYGSVGGVGAGGSGAHRPATATATATAALRAAAAAAADVTATAVRTAVGQCPAALRYRAHALHRQNRAVRREPLERERESHYSEPL